MARYGKRGTSYFRPRSRLRLRDFWCWLLPAWDPSCPEPCCAMFYLLIVALSCKKLRERTKGPTRGRMETGNWMKGIGCSKLTCKLKT
jgi:hypothetical protein